MIIELQTQKMNPNEPQLSLVEDLNEIAQKRDAAQKVWQQANSKHATAREAACCVRKIAKRLKKTLPPSLYRSFKSFNAKLTKNAETEYQTALAKLRDLEDLNEEVKSAHIEASQLLEPFFELQQSYVLVRRCCDHHAEEADASAASELNGI